MTLCGAWTSHAQFHELQHSLREIIKFKQKSHITRLSTFHSLKNVSKNPKKNLLFENTKKN